MAFICEGRWQVPSGNVDVTMITTGDSLRDALEKMAERAEVNLARIASDPDGILPSGLAIDIQIGTHE